MFHIEGNIVGDGLYLVQSVAHGDGQHRSGRTSHEGIASQERHLPLLGWPCGLDPALILDEIGLPVDVQKNNPGEYTRPPRSLRRRAIWPGPAPRPTARAEAVAGPAGRPATGLVMATAT